jgi:predicted transcriptional regulator
LDTTSVENRKGAFYVSAIRKLPDAEFDIMKVVWANEPPITTSMVIEQLGWKKAWKAQTILTLMVRLVDRGFLSTEKRGKRRMYFPLVGKEDYLKFETDHFMTRFHENSFASFIAALYDGDRPQDSDLAALETWFKERKG